MSRRFDLPADAAAAVQALRDASKERDVVVFKKSPICPVSTRAEFEFLTWAKGLAETDAVSLAMVDVIAEKPLARGLTKELGIDHQSPQALWFRGGELLWHDSHGALTQARFAEAMGDAEASARAAQVSRGASSPSVSGSRRSSPPARRRSRAARRRPARRSPAR